MRIMLTLLLCCAAITTALLAVKVGGLIGMVVGVAAVDLLSTLFGKPLFGPGPWAKHLYGATK